tara:strand:+ start:273 stop:581 length:309 start_codon:yes stop_codon:yes gene_type:complete
MAELKLGMDELQHLLKLAGVETHEMPDGSIMPGATHGEEPEAPCDSEEEPKVIAIDVDDEDGDSAMQFPKTDVNPDASMTTDKEVLTSIIRDRLKDYLRNSK